MSERYSVLPLTPLRKVIAARMTEAKQTIPHFRLVADLEVDALLELRRDLRAAHPERDLSINDLLIKACAMALIDSPALNIQWVEGELRQYRTADISIVTALEGGLSTPILRSAETKSVWEIAREVRELGARAACNALKLDEVFGGTFSISNLGMYGVDQFDAIINPPQCAILAVGRARPRYVPMHGGGARSATQMRVTLSVDHRAVDGVTAAKFLSALRERIEHPVA
jgi:pyruvate dehydrogenase E2 component (dihydrolipoamide acetyltransferase)